MGLIYYALYKGEGQRMMYIGKVETETGTGRTFQDRKDEHIKKAAERDTDFHNMLFRKGIDNWKWGLLDPNYPDALLNEREKYWITKYKGQKSIILTNEVHNKREKKKNTTQNDFAKRSASQNSLESVETMAWHYKWGKIKPVKNNKNTFRSINQAAKEAGISAGSIRYSCTTGRPAKDNQKYVFIDFQLKRSLMLWPFRIFMPVFYPFFNRGLSMGYFCFPRKYCCYLLTIIFITFVAKRTVY